MVETELVKTLTPFGKTYPFEIPDTETGNALAYRRIGNRVITKYYDGEHRVSEAMFYVIRQTSNYLDLCNDQEFLSSVNKYSSEKVLSIRDDGYDDFKTSTGQFERQYRLIILHKEEI